MRVKYTLINGECFYADVRDMEEANNIAKNTLLGVNKIEEVFCAESDRTNASALA